MATKSKDSQKPEPSRDGDRAAVAAARAEVVDILAGAIFTLLLQGRVPSPRPELKEQRGEYS